MNVLQPSLTGSVFQNPPMLVKHLTSSTSMHIIMMHRLIFISILVHTFPIDTSPPSPPSAIEYYMILSVLDYTGISATLLQQESMNILTHRATKPRLKTFVTPFGWGKDLRKQIPTLRGSLRTSSRRPEIALLISRQTSTDLPGPWRGTRKHPSTRQLLGTSWPHIHRKVWMIFRFAVITWNSPKQLEKPCITKGQYLSIFRVDFLM